MKVIIFGNRDFASLAHYYLQHESGDKWYDVVAFCAHAKYMGEEVTFEGKRLVPFETMDGEYSPGEYKVFAPINYGEPRRQQKIYNDIKAKGYEFITYIHPSVKVPSVSSIGENCFILEDNTIQPYVTVGDNCVLWSGNHIGHHSNIDSHVMFTSHVVLSGHCQVDSHSFLGVNSTIRDGRHIAEGSLIGMGSLVTKHTQPWGVYMGAPAKRTKDILCGKSKD